MLASALTALRDILGNEAVTTRWIDRMAFARDASLYRLVPTAVVRPSTTAHMTSLIEVLHRYQLHCTFRAAGTSLSGQAVTDGILVDISRHWTNIEVLDDGQRVRVEPGVTGGRVNATLRRYGRRIGPDPASLIACMVGGIVANNASGMCCGTEHNSYHTIDSIRFILPDGTCCDTAFADADARLLASSPDIHAGILALREEIRHNDELVALIRRKYRIKNTIGYSINAFLDEDEPVRILGRLMVGSEGTLGFIDEVVFRTIPDPTRKWTAILIYPSLDVACASVPFWRDTGAAAVELMDDASLASFAGLPTTPDDLRITERGAAALLVEYHDVQPPDTHHDGVWTGWTSDVRRQAQLWHLRKGLMPTVGAMRPTGTTMINEDVAVPPERLATLVTEVRSAFGRHGYQDAVIFGHAKDGNIHFIVNQRFTTTADTEQYRAFMDDIAQIVTGLDGSLKAEHGTGRNMAPFVELEWGRHAYAVMRRVKSLVDPHGIFNPGVIINDDHDIHLKHIKPVPSIDSEVDRCIECGFCEHVCPSRDLTLTPRQRITLRRELQHADDPIVADAIAREYEYDALTTCIADGMCSTVCPVGIDTGSLMKRLRSESRSSLSHRVANELAQSFGAVDVVARTASTVANAVNVVLGAERFAAISGNLHREIPEIPVWYATAGSSVHVPSLIDPTADLVYMPACGARWLGDRDGTSTYALLDKLVRRAGLRMAIIDKPGSQCCGQVFDSKGYVAAAARIRRDSQAALRIATRNGAVPVVIDASTCASAMAEGAVPGMQLLDIVGVMHDLLLPHLTIRNKKVHIGLHPGCGIAKLQRTDDMLAIANACAHRVSVPPSAACCGMAGDAGMRMPELVTAALRREIGEVRNLDDVDGWYSANTTCEIGLSHHFGTPVRSLLALLEEVTR